MQHSAVLWSGSRTFSGKLDLLYHYMIHLTTTCHSLNDHHKNSPKIGSDLIYTLEQLITEILVPTVVVRRVLPIYPRCNILYSYPNGSESCTFCTLFLPVSDKTSARENAHCIGNCTAFRCFESLSQKHSPNFRSLPALPFTEVFILAQNVIILLPWNEGTRKDDTTTFGKQCWLKTKY